MVKQFYGEFENEQKKDQKLFDHPERGFELQIFSNLPAPKIAPKITPFFLFFRLLVWLGGHFLLRNLLLAVPQGS